jgi:hypothetical protein
MDFVVFPLLREHQKPAGLTPFLPIKSIRTRFGGLNIQKRRLCVKGILAQDLGFVWGAFSSGICGIFGINYLAASSGALDRKLFSIRRKRLGTDPEEIRGGEGALSTICRGPAGFFEAHPGTPVPPAPYF